MPDTYLPPSRRGPLDPAALEPLADALDSLAEWASATRSQLGATSRPEMDARLLAARAALDLALGREPWAPENWPSAEPDCFACGNARTVDDVAWDEPVRHVPCPACRRAKPDGGAS